MRYKVEFEIDGDGREEDFLEWLNFELGVGSISSDNYLLYRCLQRGIDKRTVNIYKCSLVDSCPHKKTK